MEMGRSHVFALVATLPYFPYFGEVLTIGSYFSFYHWAEQKDISHYHFTLRTLTYYPSNFYKELTSKCCQWQYSNSVPLVYKLAIFTQMPVRYRIRVFSTLRRLGRSPNQKCFLANPLSPTRSLSFPIKCPLLLIFLSFSPSIYVLTLVPKCQIKPFFK